MDGTLTRPQLNFDAIRREIGSIPEGQPILESVAGMSPADRARAEAVLGRHERQAAATSELQPNAARIVAEVRQAGIAVALMTRNSRRSARAFGERHGITFDVIWTREDGPVKPSPEPVLSICRRLGVAAEHAWVVGDYHFDILCGRAAGGTTVLFIEPGAHRPPWADESDIVIADLAELAVHLRLNLCKARSAAANTPRVVGPTRPT